MVNCLRMFERVFNLSEFGLFILLKNEPGLIEKNLDEIAKITGINRKTAKLYMDNLASHELLEYDEDEKKYSISESADLGNNIEYEFLQCIVDDVSLETMRIAIKEARAKRQYHSHVISRSRLFDELSISRSRLFDEPSANRAENTWRGVGKDGVLRKISDQDSVSNCDSTLFVVATNLSGKVSVWKISDE